MNVRKILLILLFVATAVGAGYLLYRVFFAPAPGEEPTAGEPTVTEPGGGLPTAGEGRPTTEVGPGGFGTAEPVPEEPVLPTVAAGGVTATERVSSGAARAAIATPGGGLNYYSEVDGRFYRYVGEGQSEAMSQQTFPGAQEVTWSGAGDKAVIEFPDASKVIYDFGRQRQVTLPRHWEDFSWSGDGELLAAKSLGVDVNNRWLVTVRPDGSGAKLIEPLGNNASKVIVDVSPSAEIIAFAQTGDAVGFDTREILPIGQNQENFRALRVEGFGFNPLWTPDGQSLIYSTASAQNGYRPLLWFVNASGDSIGRNRTSLSINTWADKCTFASDTTVYCAVPYDLPEGAGLERGVAEGVPDSIMRLDLTTGSITTVGRPPVDTPIADLTVSEDESRLFFTDPDGTLQEMKLR